MQRGLSYGKGVCLSVCASVRPFVRYAWIVICDKTNESSADILIPYERTIHLLFRTQRMVGEGLALLPEILGHTNPPSFKDEVKTTIFNRYSLVAAQPLDLAKKVQLWLIGTQ